MQIEEQETDILSSDAHMEQYITRDFPSIGEINSSIFDLVSSCLYKLRGSVMVRTGRIWTVEDIEKYREEVLKKPLP